jgi:transcriptional regulator with XRE-family HTH domain
MKDPLKKSTGKLIKEHRKKKKLSQTRLGELIDRKLSTVQKYESGEITPPFDVILRMASILEIDLTSLLQGADTHLEIIKKLELKDPKDEKIEMLEMQMARQIKLINAFREREEEYMLRIEDLSNENQRLRDWKDKWEERYNAGH